MKSLLLAAAMLLPATAMAAQSGVTLTQNKAITTFHGAPGKQRQPYWTPPAAKIKVFDTLGKKPFNYNSSNGWTIANANSDAGEQQWFAFAITPKKSATVTEIVEAVGNVTGTGEVTIALFADSNGLPGTMLTKKTVKSLQTFGDCCGVAVYKVKDSVEVTKGTTYWVAAILPKKSEAMTWDAWNFSTVNTKTASAARYNRGTGWTATQSEYSAFAVFGK